MSGAIQWSALASPPPTSETREAIAAAIEAELGERTPPADVLSDSARRRVIRAATPTGSVAIKRYAEGSARPLREKLKAPLLGSAALREWGALAAAEQALQPLADSPLLGRPVALLRAGDADWLVSEYSEGSSLVEALRATTPQTRRQLLEDLGAAVWALASCGVAHGDLHAGNVLVCDGRPGFLDWQRSSPDAPPEQRARDLADLEFSLARAGVPRSGRMRLRRAALGARATREQLRGAGCLSDAVAHDHYRGRTRRSLVVGRRFAKVRSDEGHGMRIVGFADAELAAAIAAHERALRSGGGHGASGAVLKNDDRARVTRVALDTRSCIVKEVTKGGLGRRLADPFRGSPARRGWLGGHGLLARGLRACEPLAFLERTGRHSILVLEDASPRSCLFDDADPRWAEVSEDELASAILRLLLALHRRGVDHGDLQASHLFADIDAGVVRDFALIDLEAVRFERELDDAARLRALAELNASLGEARLSNAARLRIFERYARALPFAMRTQDALHSTIEASRARRHRWTGAECEAVATRC